MLFTCQCKEERLITLIVLRKPKEAKQDSPFKMSNFHKKHQFLVPKAFIRVNHNLAKTRKTAQNDQKTPKSRKALKTRKTPKNDQK